MRPGWALLLAAWLAMPVAAQAPVDPARKAEEAAAEAKLAEVRRRIVALAAEQKEAEGGRDAALEALRAADAAVAVHSSALAEADAQLQALTVALSERETERARAEQAVAAQRETLAALIRAAYAAGQHEQLKLLLAPDQVQSLSRALTYHRYLQSAQRQRVEAILAAQAELDAAVQAVQAEQARWQAARETAEAEREALKTQREAQATALRAIETDLAQRAQRLQALGRDQQAVQALLAQLRDVLADIPRQLAQDRPFASRRGQLPRPLGAAVRGRAQGEGWWFPARDGTPVRAIAPGRVAYADHLKGYGLLVILDHGGGWMSLYAYNEALLAGVGEWVEGGAALARVGRSGGQAESGLYLELRRAGQPVAPGAWWAR